MKSRTYKQSTESADARICPQRRERQADAGQRTLPADGADTPPGRRTAGAGDGGAEHLPNSHIA